MLFLIVEISLCLLTLLIIAKVHWIYKWRNLSYSFNGLQLPPGSMGLPWIGETIEFMIPTKSIDMPSFLKKRIKKYGTLFKTSFLGHPVVISVDPEFNRYILLQEGKLVQLWYLEAFAKLVGHDDGIDDLELKTNVYGRIHKCMRKMILNHVGTENLKSKVLTQLQVMVDKTLNGWASKESINLRHAAATMVFAFTSKLILSYDVETEDLAKDVLNLERGLLAFPIDFPGTNYHSSLKSRGKLFKIIQQIVKGKIQSPESRRGDFVDQLVDYMKQERCITENSITNIVIGLLYASVDTISTAITMIVKFVTENPQVVKELKKENEEVFSNRTLDKAAGWTWDQYRSLTYTRQVINETLRLSSIGPGLLRRAIADIHHADGYVIPKGWIVIVPPSGLHLNPDIYDDCLVFKPSRWQDGNASFIGKQFIPFGVGGRPCIGAQYSKALLACFLHAMIKNYRWTKLKGGEVIRNPLLKLESDFYVKFSGKDPYLE